MISEQKTDVHEIHFKAVESFQRFNKVVSTLSLKIDETFSKFHNGINYYETNGGNSNKMIEEETNNSLTPVRPTDNNSSKVQILQKIENFLYILDRFKI